MSEKAIVTVMTRADEGNGMFKVALLSGIRFLGKRLLRNLERVSSQCSSPIQHEGSSKVVVFKFSLPDANHMADMSRLVALVPYYIDLIGRYKLSSHARSKTEAARAKVAQELLKEVQSARQ